MGGVRTMDTVTLVRSAIRGLLKACGGELAGELRGLLARDDDYAAAGKPACDYDDAAAREELVDALAEDARALLAALDGRELDPVLGQAAKLLATVTGQDLEQDDVVRQHAQEHVGADPGLGAVADGPDVQVAVEGAEGALDVGEGLVGGDDLAAVQASGVACNCPGRRRGVRGRGPRFPAERSPAGLSGR